MGKNHIDGDAFNKLSLVRQFDEYKRAIDNLLEHNCEEEFLKFAIQMEAVRKKWNECEVVKMDQQEELTKLRAEKGLKCIIVVDFKNYRNIFELFFKTV